MRLAALLSLALVLSGAEARDLRVRAEFKRHNPCPATGRTTGACPGWEIDHRIAMMCGGPDAVGNLQWLTVNEHRAKTLTERKTCSKAQKSKPAQG